MNKSLGLQFSKVKVRFMGLSFEIWRVQACAVGMMIAFCQMGGAQAADLPGQVLHATGHHNPPNLEVVSKEQWERIDHSVDLGLEFLARDQQADGSFRTYSTGNPGVTSLVIMAYLSRGHQPGVGPYGKTLDRAIDYVLSGHRSDGAFSYERPDPRTYGSYESMQTVVYNTTISGLMLGELYGMTDGDRARRIQPVLQKTLDFMCRLQDRPISAQYRLDRGGWRYINLNTGMFESDLSVTCWQIMFMRSAVNAGFEVEQKRADAAIEYVRRNYESQTGRFYYSFYKPDELPRAMAGSGVLCLFLTGQYDPEIERKTGAWLLTQSFAPYNRQIDAEDHYHYAAYYCSQAMFQLGGDYWAKFYPSFAEVIVNGQRRDGSWMPESGRHAKFQNCYTTALSVLALTPPYQILPIYQR